MLALDQILAVTIFLIMFIAIVVGKVHRFIPALIGAALTIIVVLLIILKSPEAVLHVLSLEQLGQFRFWIPGQAHIESYGVNWQTIRWGYLGRGKAFRLSSGMGRHT